MRTREEIEKELWEMHANTSEGFTAKLTVNIVEILLDIRELLLNKSSGAGASSNNMDTTKVTRLEVIDHTKIIEDGGGRAYTYWNEYNKQDSKNPKIIVSLQDDGRTLKVFIENK